MNLQALDHAKEELSRVLSTAFQKSNYSLDIQLNFDLQIKDKKHLLYSWMANQIKSFGHVINNTCCDNLRKYLLLVIDIKKAILVPTDINSKT